MAGGVRQPIDLIKAKGKTHLTKAEYEQRKAEEVAVPFVDVHPPEYLTGAKQIEEFNHYAEMLCAIGIFTELDIDELARYIISKQIYLQYSSLLLKSARSADVDKLGKIQILQDKAFKQCQSSAKMLGLNITSRCKLIVPQAPENDEDYEL